MRSKSTSGELVVNNPSSSHLDPKDDAARLEELAVKVRAVVHAHKAGRK